MLENHISLFLFKQRNLSQPRKQGGSCPIAYALKNLDGLSLSASQRFVFFQNVKRLIKKNPHLRTVDYIVVIPSSSGLNFEFASLYADIHQSAIISPFEKTGIEMKSIPLSERALHQPLKLKNTLDLNGKSVLIIDDLVSTGTTLKSATALLVNAFPSVKIQSLSLFQAEV